MGEAILDIIFSFIGAFIGVVLACYCLGIKK